jgi:hypothetical protein
VRPERITLEAAGAHGPDARGYGQVELSTYLGAVVEHVVRLAPDIRVVVRSVSGGTAPAPRFAPGERVALRWPLAAERIFDANDRPLKAAEDAEEQQDRVADHA